jgi:heme/copper-type cytochrome/quinol oxidase subunit 3
MGCWRSKSDDRANDIKHKRELTMADAHDHGTVTRTFVWIAVMVSLILFKGFMAFFIVSDMGQPTWAYRSVQDVPAQSPYAKYQLLPSAQHVRGIKGE